MRHSLRAGAMAVVLGLAGLAVTPASATPLAVPSQISATATTTNPLVVDVRTRYDRHRHRARAWDRRRDGRRCLYRYGDCRHYHRGYWYVSPWWLFSGPRLGVDIVIPGGNRGRRHVAWCEAHYRSYDRRTNTWVGYSGRVYQCNSPYDNR